MDGYQFACVEEKNSANSASENENVKKIVVFGGLEKCKTSSLSTV